MTATPACRHEHVDRALQSGIFIKSIRIQGVHDFHQLGCRPAKQKAKHQTTKKLKEPVFPNYLLQSILWLYSTMLCAVSVQRLTWRSEVICTDLKVTSSFQTGCACPMATLVRFIWLSHCKKRKEKESLCFSAITTGASYCTITHTAELLLFCSLWSLLFAHVSLLLLHCIAGSAELTQLSPALKQIAVSKLADGPTVKGACMQVLMALRFKPHAPQ